jgi:hypothetical protein
MDDQRKDDPRKTLAVSGVYLGDITLALAGLAREIPAWAAGLDLAKFASEAEAEGVAREVEKVLASGGVASGGAASADAAAADPKVLAPLLAEITIERAIARGKFLSATRCLEILNKRDHYVGKYLERAQKHMGEHKMKEAAEALAIAASLEINEGTPLFQYTGPALHEGCTTSREKCVTAVQRDPAVLKALQYLLEGPKACEAVGAMTAETRAELLPFVAEVRDPAAADFYRGYKQAHGDLEAIEQGELAALVADLKRVYEEVERFAAALAGASPSEIEGREAFEKVLRSVGSLRKEFSEITGLVDSLELRRIKRRVEQLIETRGDLESAGDAAKKGSGLASAIEKMLALVEDLSKKGMLESIDAIEEKIVATQVTMLGRAVHSQEHWQYLRELAFKYPVSPLVCCVRRINAKWMVVPAWSSPLAALLVH